MLTSHDPRDYGRPALCRAHSKNHIAITGPIGKQADSMVNAFNSASRSRVCAGKRNGINNQIKLMVAAIFDQLRNRAFQPLWVGA